MEPDDVLARFHFGSNGQERAAQTNRCRGRSLLSWTQGKRLSNAYIQTVAYTRYDVSGKTPMILTRNKHCAEFGRKKDRDGDGLLPLLSLD